MSGLPQPTEENVTEWLIAERDGYRGIEAGEVALARQTPDEEVSTTTIVGACQDCWRPITLGEAQEELEDGGVRFTITSDGAWHCLRHGIPFDVYERGEDA